MQEWSQFFRITYHPADEIYIVHWVDTFVPLDERGWRSRENAIKWISENCRKLLDERFEQEVLK